MAILLLDVWLVPAELSYSLDQLSLTWETDCFSSSTLQVKHKWKQINSVMRGKQFLIAKG